MFQKKNYSSYPFTHNGKEHVLNFLWTFQHTTLSTLAQLSNSITNWETNLAMMLINNRDTEIGAKFVEALFPSDGQKVFVFSATIKKEARDLILTVAGETEVSTLFKTIFEPSLDFILSKNSAVMTEKFDLCHKRVEKMFSTPSCKGDINFLDNQTHIVFPQVSTERVLRFTFPNIFPTATLEKLLNEEIPENVFDVFKPLFNDHDVVNIDHTAAYHILSEMKTKRTIKHSALMHLLSSASWEK